MRLASSYLSEAYILKEYCIQEDAIRTTILLLQKMQVLPLGISLKSDQCHPTAKSSVNNIM